MKVLVVGSGAREHALAWRLHRDGADVICAPGNGGTVEVSRSMPVAATDGPALVELARQERVDLVVVGPEAPLVDGLVDALNAAGIAAFGPTRAAAQIEGSKVFAKELMRRHGIPTAAFRVFDDAEEAERYVREAARPLVVKADGLAAGKGVIVADDTGEALAAIRHIMRERAFGDAGARIVIEERLSGEEVSYHVIADGTRAVALAPAQDHKRILDGDRGPNTGGMGAYSPPRVVTPELEARILAEVVEPTLRGMAEDGTPYRGVLFVGLMIVDGALQVLEYNCRFGDPETQVLMTRIGGQLAPLLLGAARGELPAGQIDWEAPASLAVVLAASGYPGAYSKGAEIGGLDQAARVEGVTVFHAGTVRENDRLLTAGGRVLSVTAVGTTVDEAAERAYRAAELVSFEGKHYRRDIGWRARVTSD